MTAREGCFWRYLWGGCSRNGTSDFGVLLGWEKELKGISSRSSQQRELSVLAEDRSFQSQEVLQIFRAHRMAAAVSTEGQRLLAHVLRLQEMFGSSQACSILQIRDHAAEAKPCLHLGRVLVATSCTKMVLFSSLLAHPYKKAKAKQMFYLFRQHNLLSVQTLLGFAI